MSVMHWPTLLAVLGLSTTGAWSAQPSPAAVEAYNRAVTAVQQRGQLSCSAGIESMSSIPVQRLPLQDSAGADIRPDGALTHHWWAAMFVPHAQSEDIVTVLKDYDHHAEVFAPDVRYSRLLGREGSRYHVVHETLSKNLITVGLRIESLVDWSGNEQDGFASHSHTVRVTEFEHAGTRHAIERTANQTKGWLWSEDSWWHVSHQSGGACVTYEIIALTRDIPRGLGWLLRPIADRFPVETLTNMLLRTRAAVQWREFAREGPSISPTSDYSVQGHLGRKKAEVPEGTPRGVPQTASQR